MNWIVVLLQKELRVPSKKRKECQDDGILF